MKVPVTLRQKVDGVDYEGTLQIGEKKFNWDVHLGAPMEKILSQEVEINGPDDVRKIFAIRLKAGDTAVELSNDLFVFLMTTAIQLTLDFYQMPQTRDANAGSIQFYASQLGGKATFGIEASYDIPEERIPAELK